MRRCVWIMALAVLGLGWPGCGRNQPARQAASSQPPILSIGAQPDRPELEIVAGDGNLGTADFGVARSCVFTLRNNSTRPLSLEISNKSCSCAGTKLESSKLSPGQSTTVTLSWIPKVEAIEPGLVRVWAEIQSSANAQPIRLEATGRLEPRVQFAFPRGPLDFGRLSPADLDDPARKLVVEVFSKSEILSLKQVTSTQPGIQVLEPYEPLPADRVAVLQAVSGFRMQLRPTTALPQGQFQGEIRIKTQLSETPLAVPLHGSFDTSAVSLSRDRVELPPRLSLREGYRVPPIVLTVRYGACTRCEVAAVEPAFLEARVVRQGEGNWKVEIVLPRGEDAARAKLTEQAWRQLREFGFDSGQLVLSTDHPDAPRITIPITGSLLLAD